MNWYFKAILAQAISTGLEGYLDTLGISPDIMQYILSLNKGAAQFLTNEVRKNPSLTLQQLQKIQIPTKNNIDPYLAEEKQTALRYQDWPQFQKWILVSFRKLRKGAYYKDSNNNLSFPFNHPNLNETDYMMYRNFKEEIPGIWDWVRSYDINISSYSPNEAAKMSQEWHRMMAGKGEGKMYEPTKSEDIIYGPNWKNTEYNGWTIQKVTSENDLLTEGNKMDHCVGSYCEDVEKGNSFIYSLRDPNNNPHITIEINPTGSIEQIQGHSNQEPDNKYKAMIKEWMMTEGKKSGIQTEINAFENLENNHYYDSPNIEEISDTIDKVLNGEPNEYGLTNVWDTDFDTVLNELTELAENSNRRDNSYFGEIVNTPGDIVALAVKEDLNLDKWPKHRQEYNQMLIQNPNLKRTSWKNIQEIEQWAWDEIDKIQEDFMHYEIGLEYPQEEDFETPEEYEEAMDRYDEAESEIHDEWLRNSLRGGFSKDLLDQINRYRKEGIIPSTQELFNKKNKEKQLQTV